ncbi:MAG: hypothetical protein ACOYNG_06700 [Terrimicrobiaceae bacterium]|jgi:hypothetical protein
MNNVQPIAPLPQPVWPEVNAATAKSTMSASQVGATEIPVRDSVIATGKPDLPQHKSATDTVEAPHREMVREWAQGQTEVRPDLVQKGKEWNVDPSYPALDVLNGIATLFVASALTDGTIS